MDDPLKIRHRLWQGFDQIALLDEEMWRRAHLHQPIWCASDKAVPHGDFDGIALASELVEMQGGKIWFESEYRKGTTFHFTVPVAEE